MRTFHTVKFALHDRNGLVVGVVGVSTDITDRKRDGLRLRVSERQLLEAQRVARLGSWEWDLGENRVTWTDELYRIFGLTRAEVEPSYAAYLARIHPEDQDRVRSTIDGACTGRQPFATECRIIRPDGGVQQIHVRAEPVVGEDGTLCRLVVSVQDLTERCEVEERLNQSAKMEAVGRLAGGIAHDINNLLTAILGYAALAMGHSEAGAPQAHALEQIRKAAERGASLTQQLLAFSRKQILVPEVLDLGSVVADLSKLLGRVIGEEIALSTVIHPGTHAIRADRGQIGQVILNLAVNARDAMPCGKLVIEVRDACAADATDELRGRFNPERFVVLSVSDTGLGMDAKTRRRIFEPFFTTKSKAQGTGLGLATVYGIVEQSGGRIAIHSEPGHGARFDVFLPRSLQTAATVEAADAAPAQLRGTETLILAEDVEIVRRLAREVLESNGYRVIEAANGDQALQLLDRHTGRIDLLQTDVVMPGVNGRELSERVVARRPAIRVLYMSGHTDDAVVRRGVRAHGLAFLP